jgi:hypothetical protein
MTNPDALQARAKTLRLHGLLAHWPEAIAAGWAASLIEWEEDERARRSLERRLQGAHIGRFKPLCDFDWNWPAAIDRATFEALMTLDFLKDATNAVLVGPNGVGKSTLARNLAHEALIQGHTVLFTSAGQPKRGFYRSAGLTESTICDGQDLKSGLIVLLYPLLKLEVHLEKLTRGRVGMIIKQRSEIRSFISAIPILVRQADFIVISVHGQPAGSDYRLRGSPPFCLGQSRRPWPSIRPTPRPQNPDDEADGPNVSRGVDR